MQIRFGEYELDEALYLLTRAGERVSLRPKVFDLLAYLVRHRVRVVRREELVERLWDTTAVGPGSLSGLINELRQALGEDGRGESSIRTVHARGYQFVARVESISAGTPQREGPIAVAPERPGSRVVRAAHRMVQCVAERGACGVVVEIGGAGSPESSGSAGVPERLAELLDHADQEGFETHRILAGDESMATPARLARQLIDSMARSRGREAVASALPLPARMWLRESARELVAGGLTERAGGPSDPLGSIVALLSYLSRRRPIVILLEEVERAGARFARDVATCVERLDREPVLWIATTRESAARGAWLRVLQAEGGFERWPLEASVTSPLDHTLRRRGLDPLPTVLAEAITRHVRGDPVGIAAIADWIDQFARAAREHTGGEAARASDPTDAPRALVTAASPMRRVTPGRVAGRFGSGES